MDRRFRLQLIMDAAGNAASYLKGLRGDADLTSKSVRAARDRVSDLQKTSRDISGYRASQAQLEETRRSMTAARAEVQRLGSAMDATARPSKSMAKGFELAKTKLVELGEKEQGHIRRLADLDRKLEGAGVSTKALGAHELALARDLKKANQALDEQHEKLKKVEARQAGMKAARSRYDATQQLAGTAAGAGASAIGAGAVVAAPLALATRSAVSFEDAMLDVKKVVDFETPEQLQQMNQDVLELSTNLGLPAEGIAQIIAAAGQAKIARGDLKIFAQDAGQMGVAFGTTAEDAGQKMATWRTAFAMTQDQVRAFADQINYLGDNGNATALAISDVVTRVGPLGGVAGLAAAEVAALGSTIVGMGVAEEIAATGIKNTMLALTKGEAATKAQQKAYAALGLEAQAVARAMQVDAGGTIVDVLERVKKLTPDRQASILTQLFGSESVGAIAPVLSQLDILKTNLDAVADSQTTSGSMAIEFANRMSGAQGAIDQAQQGLKGLAITAGMDFLPMVRDAALGLTGVTKKLTAFANAHPGLVKAVGLVTAVIAGALLIFGGLALAVSAILGPFALLRFSLAMTAPMFAPLVAGVGSAASAFAAWGVSMLANPITWIVLGIVAAVALLAGAAYLVYKNWGGITAFFGKLWQGISAVFSAGVTAVGTFISTLWTGLKGAFSNGLATVTSFLMKWTPLGWITKNWGAVSTFFSSLFTAIGEVVGLGLDYVRLAILRFTPLGLIMRNWSTITAFFSRLWDGISSTIANAAAGIGGFLTTLWTGIHSGVAWGIEQARSLFMNFTPLGLIIKNWSGISGFIGTVWTRAREGVSNGIAAIKTAIANFQPLNDFKSAFAQVWTWLKDLPARLLSAGADAMKGFVQGIRGQRAAVQSAATAVAGATETAARRRLDTHSPSRVFASIGGDVMAGLNLGLRGGAKGVMARMRTTAAAVAAAGAITVPAPSFAEAQSIDYSRSAALSQTQTPAQPNPATLQRPGWQVPGSNAPLSFDYDALARAMDSATPAAVLEIPALDLSRLPGPAPAAIDYQALAQASPAPSPAQILQAPALDLTRLPAPATLDYDALARAMASATPAPVLESPALDLARLPGPAPATIDYQALAQASPAPAPAPAQIPQAPALDLTRLPAPTTLDYDALARAMASATPAAVLESPTLDLSRLPGPAPATIDYQALAQASPAPSPAQILQAPALDLARLPSQVPVGFDYQALAGVIQKAVPAPVLETALPSLVQIALPSLPAPSSLTPAPEGRQPSVTFDAALPFASPGPPAVPAERRPSIGSITLHVHGAPGQDPREIADEVMRLLNQPNLGTYDDDGDGLD